MLFEEWVLISSHYAWSGLRLGYGSIRHWD